MIAGFIGIITFKSDVGSAASITLYVGGSGPGNYTSIQSAIDNASVGDTVFVYNESAPYYENLIINKTINLVGEDRDTTIINGDGTGDVIYLDADWVNITGFTMTNSGGSLKAGIKLNNSQNCRILNNTVLLNDLYGIYLNSSSNNIIAQNKAIDNYVGIILRESSNNNVIKDNDAFSNDMAGISVMSSSSTIVSNNVMANYDGIYIYSASNNLISDNNGSNNWFGIRLFQSSNNDIIKNNCSFNSFSGLGVRAAYHNNINNNNVSNNKYGIYLYQASSNNVISGNNASSNNEYGIYIYASSSHNTIIGNNMLNNNYGILLNVSTSNNTILNNNVSSNNNDGIYLISSSNNNITNNNISSNNKYGIHLESSPNNNITNNNISNKYSGIYADTSDNNLIRGNNLTNNSNAIHVISSYNNNITVNNIISNRYDGIILGGSFYNNITNNYVSHNANGILFRGYSNLNRIIDNNISSNYNCGIYLTGGSSKNNITNNNIISNIWDGIDITWGAGLNIIMNNSIVNNRDGIHLHLASGNNITSNSILSNKGYNIYFHASSDNNIISNDISLNSGSSIFIDQSSYNNLIANTISKNNGAINLQFSTNNVITNNEVWSNNDFGIQLSLSSNKNLITDNNVYSNDGKGISLDSSLNNIISSNNVSNNEFGFYLSFSSNNRLFHNNIIKNGYQAYDNTDSNFWNDSYPSGGNYWSDYSPICLDLFSGAATPQKTGTPDGICDTPYKIDTDTTDYYPLKNSWSLSYTVPTAPINIKATAGDSFINLTWTVPDSDGGFPIINYTIYKGASEGFEGSYMEIGNILFFNDTSVTNGNTNYYKVSAKNAIGDGPLSEGVNATPATLPSTPIDLTSTSGDSCVNLTWIPPSSDGGSPITNYTIYRSNASNAETLLIEIGNVLNYTDTSVTNGITYYYKVGAKNAIGEGLLSNETSAIPATIPSEPVGLITIIGNNFVNITWHIPVSDGGSQITNYKIYRSITPNDEESHKQIENLLYYNDSSVTNGITYYYKISAKNAIGEGPLSEEVSATPASAPSSPTDLTSTAGDSYINISWDKPSSDGGFTITNYIIYRGTSQDEILFLVQIENILFYNDTSVTNGVTYYYRVSAFNTVGEGFLSEVINATPSGPINLPPICTISSPLSNITISGRVEISGTSFDTDGIVQKVEIKINNGDWIQVSGTTSWSYNWDTTTVSNGQHLIYARAYDGKDYSSEVSVSVKINNPQEERSIFQEVWFWASMSFIFMIVILIAIFLFYRRKSKEQALEESGMEESELEE